MNASDKPTPGYKSPQPLFMNEGAKSNPPSIPPYEGRDNKTNPPYTPSGHEGKWRDITSGGKLIESSYSAEKKFATKKLYCSSAPRLVVVFAGSDDFLKFIRAGFIFFVEGLKVCPAFG